MSGIGGCDGMQDRAAIGAGPFTLEDPEWPTYGYDGSLVRFSGEMDTGRTREEWRDISLEMIRRWESWLEFLDSCPDHFFTRGGPPETGITQE